MELYELIEALEGLEKPNRRADDSIGTFVGSVQHHDYLEFNGSRYPRMPYFTSSVDAALLLVEALHGETPAGGVTFGLEARAQVGDGPKCGGATPALAICIAALRLKQQIG